MTLLRRLCMLAYFVTSVSIVHGRNTTCFAPQAILGERASVTCNFGVDIKTLTPVPSFNVRRGDHEDFNFRRDTVLDCDWLEGRQYCTTIKDGYRYDRRVSDHLILIIDNVTRVHAGSYYCQLAHTDGFGTIVGCNLTVTERPKPVTKPSESWTPSTSPSDLPIGGNKLPETSEAKQGGLNILLLVLVPVIVVVIAVAVGVVIYMFKRRSVDDDDSETSIEEKAPQDHQNKAQYLKDSDIEGSANANRTPVGTLERNGKYDENDILAALLEADDAANPRQDDKTPGMTPRTQHRQRLNFVLNELEVKRAFGHAMLKSVRKSQLEDDEELL